MEKNFTPYEGKEKYLQESVIIYLRHLGLLAFAVPNGGKRNLKEAISLKKQGVLPGVCDILILEPRGNYHGLFIELKVKGGKLSDHQKAFIHSATNRNYKVVVAWCLDEVIYEVENYLKQQNPSIEGLVAK